MVKLTKGNIVHFMACVNLLISLSIPHFSIPYLKYMIHAKKHKGIHLKSTSLHNIFAYYKHTNSPTDIVAIPLTLPLCVLIHCIVPPLSDVTVLNPEIVRVDTPT